MPELDDTVPPTIDAILADVLQRGINKSAVGAFATVLCFVEGLERLGQPPSAALIEDFVRICAREVHSIEEFEAALEAGRAEVAGRFPR
jgi:hypothetical protein